MTKKSTSDALRRASCSTNEVTFYGSVYFKDSNSGGPLLDISYSEGAGSMIPVYEMYLDAEADTVSLNYRYAGYCVGMLPLRIGQLVCTQSYILVSSPDPTPSRGETVW